MDDEVLDTLNQSNFEKFKEAQLNIFKKAFRDMIATSRSAYSKSDFRSSRARSQMYNSREIKKIVACGSAIEKAELSQHFFETNGLYKRIILHYATFLTYSWVLVPHLKSIRDKITTKRNSDAYYNAADFATSFQIERKCTSFARDVLIKGAYYGLIHEGDDSIAIQDLPFEYCRSRFKNQNDIDIIEFNMQFFDTIREDDIRKTILETYPKIVQKAYYKYKYKDGSKWLFLPAEIGIYFCFFDTNPFFMDLIPLLDSLDEYKEIDKKRNLQSLRKILVQKVPIDGMKLVFEPDEAQIMHDGTLDMIHDNDELDVVTTYCDIDVKDLSSDDDDRTKINDVLQLIYESAGVSKELFCATTEAGINYSLNNDLAVSMILARRFSHFFTMLINHKFSTNKIKFKFLILPISHYNQADYTSRAKELASFGYSFLTPILSTGIDQTNLKDLKELENELLNLDEILKPLQSSYTQSNKNNGSTTVTTEETKEEVSVTEEDTNKITQEEENSADS